MTTLTRRARHHYHKWLRERLLEGATIPEIAKQEGCSPRVMSGYLLTHKLLPSRFRQLSRRVSRAHEAAELLGTPCSVTFLEAWRAICPLPDEKKAFSPRELRTLREEISEGTHPLHVLASMHDCSLTYVRMVAAMKDCSSAECLRPLRCIPRDQLVDCPVCGRHFHSRCYVSHGLTGHCEPCEVSR